MLNSLSHADQRSKQGLMNTNRAVTADALQDNGRDDEAALLRSTLPVYISGSGKVKQRVANPKAERAFLDAYTRKLLQLNLAPSGNPLDWEYGPEHLHPSLKKEIEDRSNAFLNDMHRHIRDFDVVSPEALADAYFATSNGAGWDFTTEEPFDAYNKTTRQEMNDRAEADGPLHLTVNAKNKIVRDTSAH
jgi:hypothetical protein